MRRNQTLFPYWDSHRTNGTSSACAVVALCFTAEIIFASYIFSIADEQELHMRYNRTLFPCWDLHCMLETRSVYAVIGLYFAIGNFIVSVESVAQAGCGIPRPAY